MVLVLPEDALEGHLFLELLLMQFLLLGDQRLVSVLDGVFVPPVFEHLGYLCPLLALVPDVRDEDVVLPELPLLLGLVGVEVVQPPLPALLGRPVEPALGGDVELLGQLAPPVLLAPAAA